MGGAEQGLADCSQSGLFDRGCVPVGVGGGEDGVAFCHQVAEQCMGCGIEQSRVVAAQWGDLGGEGVSQLERPGRFASGYKVGAAFERWIVRGSGCLSST